MMDKIFTANVRVMLLTAFIVLVIFAPIASAVFAPLFESQTFNRLTGANTTYWDALWVELRVDCNNIKREDDH